jgi:hypothetical protein
MVLCDYGCGKEAVYQFKNGKRCCSKYWQRCPVMRKKVSHKQTKKTREKLSKALTGIKRSEETKRKIGKASKKRTHTEETKKRISRLNKQNSFFKKTKIVFDGIVYCCYDTQKNKILFCEEIRRDLEYEILLNVKCFYCGKWFRPTRIEMNARLQRINYDMGKFYCSNNCKIQCPVFYKHKYSADHPKNKRALAVEVSHELRKMVFERDEWECQRCGSIESLHCHHTDPKAKFPMFANDMDSCVTFCKTCHEKEHKKDGCKYSDLRRSKCAEIKKE